MDESAFTRSGGTPHAPPSYDSDDDAGDELYSGLLAGQEEDPVSSDSDAEGSGRGAVSWRMYTQVGGV